MSEISLFDKVAAVLRPQESIHNVLETRAPASQESPLHSTIRDVRRVIAVVTHANEDGQEHGALFIMKWRKSSPPSLLLIATLPLGSDVEIHAKQITSPLSVEAQLDPLNAQTKFSFLVQIIADGKEITFICDDADALKAFLSECKRLRNVEINSIGAEEEVSEKSHGWLAAYTHRTSYGHALLTLGGNLDLRELYEGHTLSPAFAGSPGDEDADIVMIEDEWVRKRVHARLEEYSTKRDVIIRVGNFNVNGRIPAGDLSSWLKPSILHHSATYSEPDVMVLGFQEVDLSAGALLYSTSTALEEAWTAAVYQGLGESGPSYIKLASKQLVGMLVMAFVRKEHQQYISAVSTSSIGIGIMGMLGNKGAVGLRFKFRDTTFCFVASHLAAFDNQLERRNSDYHQICRGLVFPHSVKGTGDQLRTVSASIFECDSLFWLGDLNYRIDLPDGEVRELLGKELESSNRDTLMDYDQLSHTRKAAKAFSPFHETPITFMPTYRFEVGPLGSGDYDLKRKPAWTDRILHLSYPLGAVDCIEYISHPLIDMSDHKPISATFKATIRSVDRDHYQNIVDETLKQLTGFDQPGKEPPKVQIETQTVNFGPIWYRATVKRTVKIQNPGEVACAYRIVAPEEGSSTCAFIVAKGLGSFLTVPSWITSSSDHGIIPPKGSVSLQLAAHVNTESAKILNQGQKQLEVTLVLHIEHGLDHFVALTATYRKSFNEHYTQLKIIHTARDAFDRPPLAAHKPLSAPRELLRIVEWLMLHPVEKTEELFFSVSPPELLAIIRECLDSDTEFPFSANAPAPPSPLVARLPFWRKATEEKAWSDNTITLAFGEILLEFLGSLRGSLVPPSLFPFIASSPIADPSQVLDNMAHANANAWISLTAYLQFICMQATDQTAHSQRLAAKLAPILMQEDIRSIPPILTPLQKRQFLLSFLIQ